MEQTISSTSKSPFATEPIGRLIVKFAVPCVISLLVNSLYNIVDQIFIGWGVDYLGNGAMLLADFSPRRFPTAPPDPIMRIICGKSSTRSLLNWRRRDPVSLWGC